VLRSPRLPRLNTLDLSTCGLVADGLQDLTHHLGRLTELVLTDSQLGPDAARILAAAPTLAGVRNLALRSNALGDAGVEALAASPHLAQLRVLSLGNNGIGDAGASALARSPYLASLTGLYLPDNRIGNKGAAALADAATLRNLRWIDLDNNRIRSPGAEALHNSEWLTDLISLSLDGNKIEPDKVQRKAAKKAPTLGAEERALRDAITAAPDDNPPRLRYADWLSRRGDPQGAFIRRGCEKDSDLDSRELALLDAHGESWLKPLRDLGVQDQFDYLDAIVFRRGMVERIRLEDADVFLRHAAALFEAAPALRGVVFRNKVSCAQLAAMPELGRVRELDLYERLRPQDLQRLLASCHLSGLRALSLSCEPAARGAALLAGCSQLSGLTSLSLHGSLGDDGAQALAESSHLAGLTQLELIGTEIGPAGVSRLASSPHLKELRCLHLNSAVPGERGARALADRSQPWTELSLIGAGLDAAGVAILAQASCLAGI
jgi:uncharacterized protein (TIGR02996 family)